MAIGNNPTPLETVKELKSHSTKLNTIETNAQVNKIDTIKVNGTTLSPTDKVVDITVPTQTSQLTNNSNFVTDANYVHTDANYTTTEKTKLSGISSGANKVEASNTNGNIKIDGTETNVYTAPALTSSDIITALGYTPPQENTTYSQGTGISINASNVISNSGVRSISQGTANGTISVNTNGSTENVSVKGLSDLAYISKGSGSTKFLREDGTWQSDNNTTYTFATGSANGTISVTPSGGSASNISVKGLSGAAYKSVDTSITTGDTSTGLPTTAAVASFVASEIDGLPEPMVFQGSLGTGGTITTLPSAGSSNKGYTYKVITAGTYASQSAKVGDTFISDGTNWVLIPSGDEPGGTVTSVTINATGPIAIDSSSAITTSGTRTISHSNSGVTAGTYRSVTVNATGHVTSGTNPTTLSGYGITDAKIASGVITLGSNTITPLTASSTLDATKLSGTIPSSCYTDTDTKNTAGSTDTSSKIFLIGATSQAANPQTYSQDTAYVGTDGHLYSNSLQVVNLSGSQALTNKTYNGLTLTKATTGFTIAGGTTSKTLTVNNTYTLGAACAKGVDTSLTKTSTSTNLPTSAAVASLVSSLNGCTTTATSLTCTLPDNL